MPIADMSGSTSNSIGASRMQGAVNAQQKQSLVGGIGALGQGVVESANEEAYKKQVVDALVKAGLDPSLAVDPHTAFTALADKRKADIQSQQQGEAFKHSEMMQERGFEHSDAQRSTPTYAETREDEARAALGKAYAEPIIAPRGEDAPWWNKVEQRKPTEAEAQRRFIESGKAPASAVGQTTRLEGLGLRAEELGLSRERLGEVGRHNVASEGLSGRRIEETERRNLSTEDIARSGQEITKRGQDLTNEDRDAALEETKAQNAKRNEQFLLKFANDIPDAVAKKVTSLNAQMMGTFNREAQNALQREVDTLLAPYIPKAGPTQTLGRGAPAPGGDDAPPLMPKNPKDATTKQLRAYKAWKEAHPGK